MTGVLEISAACRARPSDGEQGPLIAIRDVNSDWPPPRGTGEMRDDGGAWFVVEARQR